MRCNKKTNFLGYVSLLLLFATVLLMSFPLVKQTNNAVATNTLSNTDLTLTTSGTILLPGVNNASGTFVSSDPAAFTVNTNNYAGYTLELSASNTNNIANIVNTSDTYTKLVNINDPTYYFTSISSPSTEQEFAIGNWGYLINKTVGASNANTVDGTKYQPAPDQNNNIVLDITDTANLETNSYTVALGLKVDYRVPAGVYANSYILTAVANQVTYTITYDKNTDESVSGMPAEQVGTVDSTIVNVLNTTPTRAHYTFLGWCTATPTTDNGVDSCSATIYQPGDEIPLSQLIANAINLKAMWKIDTFTHTTQVRYQNVDGSYGSYSEVDRKTLNYGSSYSWSTSQISGFDTTTYQSASVATYTVVGTQSTPNYVSIARKTHTCSKQYRLQDKDGNFPSTYTADGSETIIHGATCSYSKTLTDYKNTASGTNGAAASTSGTITADTTLSLSMYRNTYSLTVSGNSTYFSNPRATTTAVHGSNYYRWGQGVAITATINYGYLKNWTVSSGTSGTFADSASLSTTYTMPKGASTVYANGTCATVSGTMQAFTGASTYCLSGTLTDSRNSQSYTVAKLGGVWWMTKNLRFTGTSLSTSTSNVTSNKTLTYYDLVNDSSVGGKCYDDYSYPNTTMNYSGGFTNPCIKDSTKGTYYNYVAATAGTIKGVQNNTDATQDVCPAGWKIPTKSEAVGSVFNNSTTYVSAFNATAGVGGGYVGGALSGTGRDVWWTSNKYTQQSSSVDYNFLRNILTYNYLDAGTLQAEGGWHGRSAGYHLRCIKK